MSEPTALPCPGAEPQAVVSRRSYQAALRLTRRIHMYAGLFMTPWVLLYGVTGFLFNHPDAFADREIRTAGRSAALGTAMEHFPTSRELADEVVAALNARETTGRFRLVDRDRAAYSRNLFITAVGDGREHSVRFDPDSGASFIRSLGKAGRAGDIPWPSGSPLPLPDPPRAKLARGIPALLANLGIDAHDTTVRNPPDLLCTVEHGGRLWRVAYNVSTGATTLRPAEDQASRLSTRLFLTRMHLSFGYPSRPDARWFWAIAVDAMFVSMVFWGFSGVLMWWQMKKLRIWGLATLLASLATASAMAVGMHAALVDRF